MSGGQHRSLDCTPDHSLVPADDSPSVRSEPGTSVGVARIPFDTTRPLNPAGRREPATRCEAAGTGLGTGGHGWRRT
jgi:hypothetical protein